MNVLQEKDVENLKWLLTCSSKAGTGILIPDSDDNHEARVSAFQSLAKRGFVQMCTLNGISTEGRLSMYAVELTKEGWNAVQVAQ